VVLSLASPVPLRAHLCSVIKGERPPVKYERAHMSTRQTMTFRIEDALREKLRQLADKERRSMAWLVEEAVKEFVRSRSTKPGDSARTQATAAHSE
jgi:hypothetical protein